MTTKLYTRVSCAALIALGVSTASLGYAQTKPVSVTQAVAGPVTFRMRGVSADITVTAHAARTIQLRVASSDVAKVTLVKQGNAWEARFDGKESLRHGAVTVNLPAGSNVDLRNVSGSARLTGLGGDVRIRTVSGDLRVDRAKRIDVAGVSADLKLRRVSGAIQVKTVSGDIDITTTGAAASQVEVATTSGSVDWTGRCGKGCDMKLKTLSGSLKLTLDRASAFGVKYSSFSGDFKDDLGVKINRSKANRFGGKAFEGTYGAGTGAIKARTFSGRLVLKKK